MVFHWLALDLVIIGLRDFWVFSFYLSAECSNGGIFEEGL
jgi:hypothetical protein